MKSKSYAALLLSVFVLAVPAQAADVTQGDLTLSDPFTFETPRTAKAGGGYVTIVNTGAELDRLVGVEGDFPKIEIHTVIQQDGRMMMRPAGVIDVGPGETVALEPGGYHVMFMGLSDPFELGETVEATLIFEKAGPVPLVFEVRSRDGHKMGHGAHTN